MHNFKNKMKEDLRAGKTCYGSFVTSPSAEVVEILAIAGFDFVIIDTEHTASNIETVVDMFRAAEVYGMTPMVRVPDDTPKNMSRYQDVGAYGVQIPMVHTVEQAEKIVKAMKYKPDGDRGMSGGIILTSLIINPQHLQDSNDRMKHKKIRGFRAFLLAFYFEGSCGMIIEG